MVWEKALIAGDLAFCSGGDQKVRGHAGYIGEDGIPRLNLLDLLKKIRSLPKPVVAEKRKPDFSNIQRVPQLPRLSLTPLSPVEKVNRTLSESSWRRIPFINLILDWHP